MGSPWWTRRAIGLHVTLALTLPAFLALGWWQLRRALDGNSLSWAYTFEWPLFAAYAVFMWWRLVHEQPGLVDQTATSGPDGPAATSALDAGPDAEPDEDLAAYNAYLADLATQDARRRR